MASVLENQNIAKRQKISFRHNNKSAGFDTGFMSQFNQKPVHGRNKNHTFVPIRQNTRRPQKSYKKHEKPDRNEQNNAHENTKKSGFSFSVPSAATLVVVAGTVLVSLIALKWEDININKPEKYIIVPSIGEDGESRIFNYAATGISGITSTFQFTEKEHTETGTTSIKANDEAPHGLLITFEWRQYKVQKGDSVTSIAKKYGVSIGAIIASNEISNARRLQEGAVLKIPNIDGIPYTIKTGDNLSKISSSFNVPLDVILDVNDIKSDNIKAGETIFIPGARMNDMDLRLSLGELYIYPLQNKYITSRYGMRKDPISGKLGFHSGIDFRANTGTTVMASMDGVVSVVSENWSYGKYIIISHSNGYKTFYAHLSSSSVKQGDKAYRGRKIGEAGNTGYSTGPHLHFGIFDKNGQPVNPLELLN